MDQEARDTLRKAAEVVGDMRFMQAASITALRLNGKAYAAAKTYMNELADLQKQLQDMALGETK